MFHFIGENVFVADFETQREQDCVKDGAPWHISKNLVNHMVPSELKPDRLQMWARVFNLCFNMRNGI